MTGTPGRNAETAGTPRWVKAFGIVALLVGVLVAVLILTGRGGEHSPRRHMAPIETPASGADGGPGRPPPAVAHPRP